MKRLKEKFEDLSIDKQQDIIAYLISLIIIPFGVYIILNYH